MLDKLKDKDVFSLVREDDIDADPYFWEYYKGRTMERQVEYIRNVLDFAQPSGDVLSVGCGFGLDEMIMKDMTKGIGKMIGLDIISPKVKYMRNISNRIGIDCMESVYGDGARLPFLKQTFDHVFLVESLSHMEYPYRALEEGVRVLKKEGHVFVMDFNNGMNPRMLYRSWKLKLRKAQEDPVNPYLVGIALRDYGMDNIEMMPYNFPSDRSEFKKKIWKTLGKHERLGMMFSSGFMLRGTKAF